jgi:hypothetical protein
MSKLKVLALIAVCALASCGAPADNPENIPVAGKWRDEGKLMSVKQGGMAIDSAEFPDIENIKAKMETKEFCGEPYFRTKEQFQTEVDRSNPAECVVESVEPNGNRISVKGTCKTINRQGVDARMAIRGEATESANSIIYNMSIHVTMQEQLTGMGDTVTVEAKRTMTRIGDC